jgi:hypothetical protein
MMSETHHEFNRLIETSALKAGIGIVSFVLYENKAGEADRKAIFKGCADELIHESKDRDYGGFDYDSFIPHK